MGHQLPLIAKQLLVTLAGAGIVLGAIEVPSFAQIGGVKPSATTPPQESIGYQRVPRAMAVSAAIDVNVYHGRTTVIDFSPVGESITFLSLGDPSQIVFNTDVPLDSGQAATILLRVIEPLSFPGATSTTVTNLVVKTVDISQQQRLYNFQIVHCYGVATDLGVQIIRDPIDNSLIVLGGGRTGHIDDVEKGLMIAVRRGYTTADDPIVLKIKNFLAMVRNQDLSLVEAAGAVGVDFAVITELALIAIEESVVTPVRTMETDDDSEALSPETSVDNETEPNNEDEQVLPLPGTNRPHGRPRNQ